MSKPKSASSVQVAQSGENYQHRSLAKEFALGTVKSRFYLVYLLIVLAIAGGAFAALRFLDRVRKVHPELTRSWELWVVMGATVLLLGLLWWVYRLFVSGILFPLRRMVERMSEITNALDQGRGDFTARIAVHKRDEIGELRTFYNRLIEVLQGIIVRVKSSSGEVHHMTEEVTAGSEELATRTSEQAASITETSTTLESFTAIVRRNSQNAEEVSTTLLEFNEDVQNKQELIHNVTKTKREIDDSSKKIENIINVINDISFQTNLLALNAAVEAARAGEAGRGFAVVASEVRNLAQKTAESSKTIQEIVTRNVESTRKGMDLVGETSTFFSSILQVMQTLVDKVEQITQGSREQSTGIEQIQDAISQLENVINQNAALVEEFSGMGKKMKGSAGELLDLVRDFTVEKAPSASGKPEVKGKPETKGKPEAKGKPPAPRTTASKPAPTHAPAGKKPPPPPDGGKGKGKDVAGDDFFGTGSGFEEF